MTKEVGLGVALELIERTSADSDAFRHWLTEIPYSDVSNKRSFDAQ
jgi:hypothetical protein